MRTQSDITKYKEDLIPFENRINSTGQMFFHVLTETTLLWVS